MKIELTDFAVAELRSIYLNKDAKIQAQIKDLQNDSKEIQSFLAKLKHRKAEAEAAEVIVSNEYSKDATWMDKAAFVMKQNGGLSAKQAADLLVVLEGSDEPKKVLRSVSATLSVHSKGKSARFTKTAQNGDDYQYNLNPRYKG